MFNSIRKVKCFWNVASFFITSLFFKVAHYGSKQQKESNKLFHSNKSDLWDVFCEEATSNKLDKHSLQILEFYLMEIKHMQHIRL